MAQRLSLTDASLIDSATKWERHGALCNHYLRKQAEKLDSGEWMKFSESIAKASDNRDKAIQKLNLDRDIVKDAWAAIDVTEDSK